MNNLNFPDNLLYNLDFSWVKIDGEIATLGIIKPAADKVKEFVFIKLPKEGEKVARGETYTSLEALKWSGQIASPLSGEIVEVHQELFDQPAIINQDPYGKGWIAKLKVGNPEEIKELLDSKQIAQQASGDLSEEVNKSE